MTHGRPSARGGLTLVVVVVLLLALQLLAHGVLLAALHEWEAARAARSLVTARFAAEAAVARATGALRPEAAELGVGETRLVTTEAGDASTVRVLAERLGSESWLVEGAASVVGWPGQVRRARMVWIMDPLTRIGAAAGVVTTALGAPVQIAGAVETDVVPGVGEEPASCVPWLAQLDSVIPGRTLPAVAPAQRPAPRPRLGLLTGEDLVGLSTAVPRDSLRPAPVFYRGRCAVESPGNWGGRVDGRSGCLSHFVLVAREGDLRLAGGVGQGVLVVTGDLVLETGAAFSGMVLVGGALRLRSGASLAGLAEASGGVVVEAGAVVRGSACAAMEALTAVGGRLALPRPHPALRRGWVAPLPARR